VARRSDGRVRIRVLDNFGGEGPDVEQRLLDEVAAGKADLGSVGTRVLDTVGVHTFEALTAPFLIDSYPLQRAVFASGLPDTMLPALGDAGVTGLAVVAGGLRRPVSVRAPLATLDAWHGTTFETFRSSWQMAAIAALGATPTDIVRNDLAQALQDGTVHLRIRSVQPHGLTAAPSKEGSCMSTSTAGRGAAGQPSSSSPWRCWAAPGAERARDPPSTHSPRPLPMATVRRLLAATPASSSPSR
jgi:hypothetical protein